MGAYLIQSKHGTKGNFELVVPPSHGEGLAHYWRNNDVGTFPWTGPTCFGRGNNIGTSLIQSNYGSVGNLEVVAVDDTGGLKFYWRMDHSPWTWNGPFNIAGGLRGVPSLIQSRHGTEGNFEVVVPHRDGGLAHLWRDNDNPSMPWNGPFRFGDRRVYNGAAVIQGNYGSPGNLEVVAVTGDELVFFWRMDHAPWTWNGPFTIARGLRGSPSLIQSRHGRKGNFEVVVPHRDGGLAHLWRDNDNSAMPWNGPFRFGGTRVYESAGMIQGNFGSPGNLEVVALDNTGRPAFFWRMDHSPWTWNGPFPIGVERSWSVSECVYGWTAAYFQADTDVTVRIRLNPDAGISAATMASLQTTWRDGIINKWSNRFDCLAPNGERLPITFNVQWVTSNPHHTVRVRPGPERSNMTTWDTSDTGDVASHEFGHMLSNPDEYADAACPARSPVNTGTVMADNTEAVARHVSRIASFHCGHSSTDRAAGFAEESGETPKMFMLERAPEAKQEEFYEALKNAASGKSAGLTDSDTKVSLTISGGPPSERYEYQIEVKADGGANSSFVDEMHEVKPEATQFEADRKDVAEVFRKVLDTGVLELPRIGEKLVPDSLIMTLTVQSGDVAKLVQRPVVEQGAQQFGEDAFALPVQDNLAIDKTDASPGLIQVLDALRDIQGKSRR